MSISQPYHLDYWGDDTLLKKLFRDADDMFGLLYQQVDTLSSSSATVNIVGGTGISVTTVGGVTTITNTGPTMAQVAARVALGV